MFYRVVFNHNFFQIKPYCLTSSSSSGGRCSSSPYPSLSSAFPKYVTAASLPEVSIASSLTPSSSGDSESQPRQQCFQSRHMACLSSQGTPSTNEGGSTTCCSQSMVTAGHPGPKTTAEKRRQRAQHCASIDWSSTARRGRRRRWWW